MVAISINDGNQDRCKEAANVLEDSETIIAEKGYMNIRCTTPNTVKGS